MPLSAFPQPISLGARYLGNFRPHFCLSTFPQTREKEKMKEAKDARYTNGHLFTTISVSGMTMCYACNKSITAKEALICPSKLFASVAFNPRPCIWPVLPGSLTRDSTFWAQLDSGPLLPGLTPPGGGYWNVAEAGLLGVG